MKWISTFWQKFKTQPDLWFFYGFLTTFTLSIRKVILFFPINSTFNEYSGVFLYLSDIFLFLTIFSWFFVILQNNFSILSIAKKLSPQLIHSFPLLLFIFWSFLSISWSENQNLAFFRSIKILEFGLLFFYIKQIVPRGTIIKNILLIIITSATIQGLIGIWQFLVQHSLGIFWLKESLISPEIPGVAKVIFNGEKYIRAYGLFPHPNILGGFLVFSIILTIWYKKMFHEEQFKKLLSLSLIIQLTALILTFSKSAIIGLILALIYINYKKSSQLFHVEQLKRKILLVLIILVGFFVIFKPDLYSFFQKSLAERSLYMNVPRGTIINNPIAGIGIGQSIIEMQNYIPQRLETWQFQPVHNVFLLILSELGIIGLGLFGWFLWRLFFTSSQPSPSKGEGAKQISLSLPTGQAGLRRRGIKGEIIVPRGTLSIDRAGAEQLECSCHSGLDPESTTIFKSILVAFIFIMLFDHYLWDIQQGQLLLWLTLGLISGDKGE